MVLDVFSKYYRYFVGGQSMLCFFAWPLLRGQISLQCQLFVWLHFHNHISLKASSKTHKHPFHGERETAQARIQSWRQKSTLSFSPGEFNRAFSALLLCSVGHFELAVRMCLNLQYSCTVSETYMTNVY